MIEQINENTQKVDPTDKPRRIMTLVGYIFLLIASGLVVFIAIRYLSLDNQIPSMPKDQSLTTWLIQYYGPGILVLFASIVLGVGGLRLLGKAGKAAPKVIPSEDRDLLEQLIIAANKEAIDLYIALSSLSGFTGKFLQIGFSGLPLATVVLTLFFSGLSFLNPAFLDLAKLTLGAFIGSFVQKGTEPEKPKVINQPIKSIIQ